MKKNLKKIENLLNKRFVVVFIVFLLTILWWSSSLIFNKYISFSVINYSYELSGYKTEPLLKNDKIKGEFRAKDSFLGIVYLRFNDFVKVDYQIEDILSFKIKEKGQKNWYYYNNYRTGQIKNSLLFPFGFPVIFDSKNRIYEFEIVSLAGNGHNSVQLSDSKVLLSGHQYSKAEIQGSKMRLINYLFKKSFYSIQSIDFILSSLVFALPLFLYLLWILVIRKFKKTQRFLTLMVGPILIIMDIFLLKQIYLGILFGLIALWFFSIKINKFESKASFLISFFLIAIWCILTFLGVDNFSSKLNVWAYSFLVIGLLHLIVEERKK